MGTRLYAPALAGIPMPGGAPEGGFVHDGCLTVDDDGADQHKVFVFAGLREYAGTLAQQISGDVALFPAGGHCR